MDPRETNAHAEPAAGPSHERLPFARPAGLRATMWKVGVDEYMLLEFRHALSQATAPTLTHAEHDVLFLMADGLTNPQIALSRGTSVRTVANQAAAIFRKLGVSSRLELFALLSGGR